MPNLAAATAQPQPLRVGQLLQAVVIKQLASNHVLLQLLPALNRSSSSQPAAPLQLQANTTQPLIVGQQLQLEVSKLGDTPLLKVLSQTASPDAVLKQALMQNLPRQTGLTPLLANISWIAQPQNSTVPLPQAIQVLAKALLDQLPNRGKIASAEGVKQAFKESGLFMESALRQTVQGKTTPAPGGDFKSLLLQLLSSIQKESAQTAASPSLTRPISPSISIPVPAVPGGRPQPQGPAEATLATLNNTLALLQELGKQVEGGLARTQLHQLASLSTSDQNPLTWSFELPIRHQERIDLFQCVINEERSENNSDEQQRRWNITIALELEPLGPMHVRLQLEDGKISTTFWAERVETTTLIGQHLTELAQRYHEAGIESRELRCFQGQPPEPHRQPLPTIVLDVNA